jgi:hypothetical protein
VRAPRIVLAVGAGNGGIRSNGDLPGSALARRFSNDQGGSSREAPIGTRRAFACAT